MLQETFTRSELLWAGAYMDARNELAQAQHRKQQQEAQATAAAQAAAAAAAATARQSGASVQGPGVEETACAALQAAQLPARFAQLLDGSIGVVLEEAKAAAGTDAPVAPLFAAVQALLPPQQPGTSATAAAAATTAAAAAATAAAPPSDSAAAAAPRRRPSQRSAAGGADASSAAAAVEAAARQACARGADQQARSGWEQWHRQLLSPGALCAGSPCPDRRKAHASRRSAAAAAAQAAVASQP